jgi:hypothetical protein
LPLPVVAVTGFPNAKSVLCDSAQAGGAGGGGGESGGIYDVAALGVTVITGLVAK